MIKNAYVHIPFCASKCHYCSFVSFEQLNSKGAFLRALKHQIEAEYNGEKLTTLYFGGGTPSLLSIDEFSSLISLFEIDDNAEITVEVNPDSVDFEYLKALRLLGVNRLSIGVQTFDDEILKLIGRRHSSEQAKSALNFAKKAGFENISLDFIYGLPTQTIQGFEADLKTAVDLGVQHISLYGLKIESESYFGQNIPKNLPDSDLQADMYLKAVEILTLSGFEHYEISNFSRLGLSSRHNLNYWENNTYFGFGCAASGYVDNVRYQNESDLVKYINNPCSKISELELSQQEILEESIFLGLRKVAGIDTKQINERFNIDFDKKYAKIIEKYSEFFKETPVGWALNLEGIMISNEILAEFID